MMFSKVSLEADGFAGWLSFPEARASGAIPTSGGVYVVTHAPRAPVAFLTQNPGGRVKGRNPTVSLTLNRITQSRFCFHHSRSSLGSTPRALAILATTSIVGLRAPRSMSLM